MHDTYVLHLKNGDLIDARRVVLRALMEAATVFGMAEDCGIYIRELCSNIATIADLSRLLEYLGGDPSWPVDEHHGAMTKPEVATLAAAARTAEVWATGRVDDPGGREDPDSYDTACWAVCRSDLATAGYVLALAEGAMEGER